MRGHDSPFYGLDKLAGRLPQILAFLELLRVNTKVWSVIAEKTLQELFPKEDLNIAIYPIIGYGMGIGLNGAACLNCNCETYLHEPTEFLFFVIHECVHVLYERSHRTLPLGEVVSPADWCSYFKLWVQNEGYAPLRPRQERGHLAERDYRVLFDPDKLESQRLEFLKTLQQLESGQPLSRETYLDLCFGRRRLTYRIGCELIRRIEAVSGMKSVRTAFYLSGNDYATGYRHLLEA